jgi:hypothetical protein
MLIIGANANECLWYKLGWLVREIYFAAKKQSKRSLRSADIISL